MSRTTSLPDPITEPEKAREVMRQQQERIQLLEAAVEELTRRLEELTNQRGSSSRNSSKPPSSDSPEQKAKRPRQRKTIPVPRVASPDTQSMSGLYDQNQRLTRSKSISLRVNVTVA